MCKTIQLTGMGMFIFIIVIIILCVLVPPYYVYRYFTVPESLTRGITVLQV